MSDVIIQGEWDGELIWRKKTAGERLAEELEKELNKKNEKTANN